jgi:ribose/xylose/arabinose/galactoside ABC-type transport system permease subunit
MENNVAAAESVSGAAAPRWRPRLPARTIGRIALVAVIVLTAAATPGILARPTVVSFLTSISFVGCVAVGMTLITISGNVLSLSLGATTAAAATAYIAALNAGGFAAAVVAALGMGALISGAQGVLIGFLRANPIIVSIATAVLIYGLADPITGNASLHASVAAPGWLLGAGVLGVPVEFFVFVAAAILAQILLSLTAFGRRVYMVGNSFEAARAAGVNAGLTVVGAYFWAGLFGSLAGLMLALRYGRASMEFGLGFDYSAIAAVLVGGTSIAGGQGSLYRTFAGVLIIGLVELVLLLRGFRQEWQYLITGVIVLAVIVLGGGRR